MAAEVNSKVVAGLMREFRLGDSASAGKLVELLYPQLRRMAAAHMRQERWSIPGSLQRWSTSSTSN